MLLRNRSGWHTCNHTCNYHIQLQMRMLQSCIDLAAHAHIPRRARRDGHARSPSPFAGLGCPFHLSPTPPSTLVKIELAGAAAGWSTRWLAGMLAGPTGWRAVLVASRSSRQDLGRVASACCRDVEVVASKRRLARRGTALAPARCGPEPEKHGRRSLVWSHFHLGLVCVSPDEIPAIPGKAVRTPELHSG